MYIVVRKNMITKQWYKMAKSLQLQCYESDLGKMTDRCRKLCGRISKCDRLRVNTHPLNNMFPNINNEQHHRETISKREYFSDFLQKPSFGERLKLREEPPVPKDEHLLLS